MIEIIKYPDNSSYVKLNTPWNYNLTHKINSYEDLWHLNQIVDAFKSEGIRPTVTIPNLIDAQADRRFNRRESSGLKLVCEFLNSMKADFRVFHPHNPEVVEALLNGVQILDNQQFISSVLFHLNLHGIAEPYKNLILMSSDAGGYKPLIKLCDKISWKGETFSASKSRKYIDGKSSITQIVDREDFEGKNILIIDDICVYGGTFKGLASLLKERNCGKIYLAVSHMTVENLGKDPVTNYFDEVFTTNSKFDKYLASYDMKMDSTPKNLTINKLF